MQKVHNIYWYNGSKVLSQHHIMYNRIYFYFYFLFKLISKD